MMPGATPAKSFRHLVHPAPAASLSGAVAAIGNFDGMHRGHQAVIGKALDLAAERGRPAVLVTFEPHPRDHFGRGDPVFRLTPPTAKARLAAALGLDGMLEVPFDARLAALTPEAFVTEVACGALALEGVVVGWNFHYGARRAGTPETLAEAGQRLGFSVTIAGAFAAEDGAPISSSRIRAALEAGDLALANGLLGFRWFFEGTVDHGDKRGRTIGYPTANLRLPPAVRLRHGIYAVFADVDGRRHQGVASFGRRPTFDNGPPVFETFLFDFSGDLYGRAMRVTPVSYLRPELKFDSVETLIAQMDRDSAEARAVLGAATPLSALDAELLFS